MEISVKKNIVVRAGLWAGSNDPASGCDFLGNRSTGGGKHCHRTTKVY